MGTSYQHCPSLGVYICLLLCPTSSRISEIKCRVKMEVDVPVSVAYDCYSDREAMPKWMPFISSVKVLHSYP